MGRRELFISWKIRVEWGGQGSGITFRGADSDLFNMRSHGAILHFSYNHWTLFWTQGSYYSSYLDPLPGPPTPVFPPAAGSAAFPHLPILPEIVLSYLTLHPALKVPSSCWSPTEPQLLLLIKTVGFPFLGAWDIKALLACYAFQFTIALLGGATD